MTEEVAHLRERNPTEPPGRVALMACGIDSWCRRTRARSQPDTVRQLLDALDALVAALGDDVGRTEFARQPLT